MTAARLDYGKPLTQDFGFDGGEWRRARRTRQSAISRVVPLRRRAPPIVSGCGSVLRLHFRRGRPDELETLSPAYFALVMATGIVAIAADLHGVPAAPTVFFWSNVVFLVGLIAATFARALRYPTAFAADMSSHSRGVGFFTAVAALAVFGDQLVLQMHAVRVAVFFCAAAGALLPVVLYGELAALTVRQDKPSLADGLNGAWLVSVVAVQSVSILTVSVLPSGVPADLQQLLMFVALVLWLAGGAMYLWLITLIFYRTTFLPMAPAAFTPPYWINMGAVAISTLAGAALLDRSALSPIVMQLAPFVMGLTLLFWAIASFWIPLLVVLEVWSHLIRGLPFAYSPLSWGGVFPLGMYSVCTYRLARTLDAPFLAPVSEAFMAVALVAWIAAFTGLVHSRLHLPDPSRSAAEDGDGR
ncbi:MAG TPA: tellurite resistance/C4-dicarboxylate transporter family protein [Roseiarcus sp.]